MGSYRRTPQAQTWDHARLVKKPVRDKKCGYHFGMATPRVGTDAVGNHYDQRTSHEISINYQKDIKTAGAASQYFMENPGARYLVRPSSERDTFTLSYQTPEGTKNIRLLNPDNLPKTFASITYANIQSLMSMNPASDSPPMPRHAPQGLPVLPQPHMPAAAHRSSGNSFVPPNITLAVDVYRGAMSPEEAREYLTYESNPMLGYCLIRDSAEGESGRYQLSVLTRPGVVEHIPMDSKDNIAVIEGHFRDRQLKPNFATNDLELF